MEELCKLLRLVVRVVIKSDENAEQVGAMQQLPYEQQVTLMKTIEAALAAPPASSHPQLSTLEEAPMAADQSTEAKHLREALALHQDQLTSAELEVERLNAENKQLRAAEQALRSCERERDALRDQMDEYRYLVDQAKKNDATLEKYQRRLDDMGDLRRRVKSLEQQNSLLIQEKLALESGTNAARQSKDDAQAISAKRLKRQLEELQHRHDQLTEEHGQRQVHVASLEKQCEDNKAVIDGYLERIRALEHSPGAGASDVRSNDLVEAPGDTDMSSLRLEITHLQKELDARGHTPDTQASAQPSISRQEYEAGLAAVQAEITAMRNNAKSKEQEAQSLLRKLAKKKSGDGKSTPKELRAVMDLLQDSFQQDDHVLQRLRGCWDQANALVRSEAHGSSNTAAASETIAAVQRERDVLRQEQRLMASAFHLMAHRTYRDASWARLSSLDNAGDRAPATPVAPNAAQESGGGSWLAQQRSLLSGALTFARR